MELESGTRTPWTTKLISVRFQPRSINPPGSPAVPIRASPLPGRGESFPSIQFTVRSCSRNVNMSFRGKAALGESTFKESSFFPGIRGSRSFIPGGITRPGSNVRRAICFKFIPLAKKNLERYQCIVINIYV